MKPLGCVSSSPPPPPRKQSPRSPGGMGQLFLSVACGQGTCGIWERSGGRPLLAHRQRAAALAAGGGAGALVRGGGC